MKKLLIAFFAIATCYTANTHAAIVRDYDFDQGRMLASSDTIYIISTFDDYDFVSAFDYSGNRLWESKFKTKVISWQATSDYVIVFSKNRSGTKTYLNCLDRYTGTILWER